MMAESKIFEITCNLNQSSEVYTSQVLTLFWSSLRGYILYKSEETYNFHYFCAMEVIFQWPKQVTWGRAYWSCPDTGVVAINV